jgi:hypothetical protein
MSVSTATDLFESDSVISDAYSPVPDDRREKSVPQGTSMFPQFRNTADEPVPRPRSLWLRLLRRVNSVLLE